VAAAAHDVAAATTTTAPGKMPAAAAPAATAVLGISQSWRTRYRNAEQQGPDDPNNMPRSVHDSHPV
jgi:hypothetical protein